MGEFKNHNSVSKAEEKRGDAAFCEATKLLFNPLQAKPRKSQTGFNQSSRRQSASGITVRHGSRLGMHRRALYDICTAIQQKRS